MPPAAPQILILADDLSGAADCAIASRAAGLTSFVLLDGGAAAPPGTQALAVDTDSRRMAGPDAAAATARTLARHAGQETRLIIKKIDSTLRGNVAAEIAAGLAVLRGMAEPAGVTAIVAPAFPAAGRTTRGGHQLVHGVPVDETELWRNEGIAGRAHLPGMLAAAGLRVAAIGLAQIRDPDRLGETLAAQRGVDALVCDAETEADLGAIAAAGQLLGRATLWAGSAGLAAHLPHAAGLCRPPDVAETGAPRGGPVVCLVGSLSGVSRAQFEQLGEADGLRRFVLAPEILRAGPDSAGWAEHSRELGAALAAGADAALMIGAGGAPDPAEGLVLCQALARLVAPHMAGAGGLIATGGETARAVLLALGVTALRLAGQVEAGIPRSRAIGGPHAGLEVITKAGGFGAPETLARCRAVLRAARSPAPLPPQD